MKRQARKKFIRVVRMACVICEKFFKAHDAQHTCDACRTAPKENN